MKKLVKLFGLVALAALIALSMVACGDNNTGSNTGPGGNTPGGNDPGRNAPAAPTGLTATATSTSDIQLRWNAVSGASGYYVYQGLSHSGSYVNGGPTQNTSVINYNLPANTTVYFKVTAYNSYGEGGFSNIASATTFPDATPTYSLDGTWEGELGVTATISGSGGIISRLDASAAVDSSWKTAIERGVVKVGDEFFRNITKTSDLTWTGQRQTINSSGTSKGSFNNATFTMSADGRTFRLSTSSVDQSTTYTTWTRR